MFTPCTSVHQALTEWRNKVALDQGKSERGGGGGGGGGEGKIGEGHIDTTGGSTRKLTDSVKLHHTTLVSPSNLISGEIILNRVENVR